METPSWRIEWSDALSMSNPEIDAEHRHLVFLVNKLNGEIESHKRNQHNVLHIMKLLLDDAITHFEHEERLLFEKSYPGAEEHAQIHSKLIGDLNLALKAIQRTDHVRKWDEIGLTIQKLLVDHLLNEDTKYIEYLKSE